MGERVVATAADRRTPSPARPCLTRFRRRQGSARPPIRTGPRGGSDRPVRSLRLSKLPPRPPRRAPPAPVAGPHPAPYPCPPPWPGWFWGRDRSRRSRAITAARAARSASARRDCFCLGCGEARGRAASECRGACALQAGGVSVCHPTNVTPSAPSSTERRAPAEGSEQLARAARAAVRLVVERLVEVALGARRLRVALTAQPQSVCIASAACAAEGSSRAAESTTEPPVALSATRASSTPVSTPRAARTESTWS
eukprot:scaffold61250_cov65-Phaeocystis_antarctica.AAC.7